MNKPRAYKTPLRVLRLEYANLLARRRLLARSCGCSEVTTPPAAKIPDNSTPWAEDPQTVDELLAVARQVGEFVETQRRWLKL